MKRRRFLEKLLLILVGVVVFPFNKVIAAIDLPKKGDLVWEMSGGRLMSFNTGFFKKNPNILPEALVEVVGTGSSIWGKKIYYKDFFISGGKIRNSFMYS